MIEFENVPFKINGEKYTVSGINNSSGIITLAEALTENITDSALGLDFVNKLRPRSFKWKDKDIVHTQKDFDGVKSTYTETQTYIRTHYGMIAQEVKGVLDDLSIDTEDFAGFVDKYNFFVFMLSTQFVLNVSLFKYIIYSKE